VCLVDSKPELKEIAHEAACTLTACFEKLYPDANSKLGALHNAIQLFVSNTSPKAAELLLDTLLKAFASLSDAAFPQVFSAVPVSSTVLAECFTSAVVVSPGDIEVGAASFNVIDGVLSLVGSEGMVSNDIRTRLFTLLDRMFRVDWERSNWSDGVFPLCELVCSQSIGPVSAPFKCWNTYDITVVDGCSLSICAVGLICPPGLHSASLQLECESDPPGNVQVASASWLQEDTYIAPVGFVDWCGFAEVSHDSSSRGL
jgi:hypothetical protein